MPVSALEAYHRSRQKEHPFDEERTERKRPRLATGESGDEPIAAEVMGMDDAGQTWDQLRAMLPSRAPDEIRQALEAAQQNEAPVLRDSAGV